MLRFVKRLLVRARGILGLGMVAGGVCFFLGAAWSLYVSGLRHGFFPEVTNWFFLRDILLVHATEWAVRGAFTAAAFGSVLTLIDSKWSLDELPMWRMGLYGAMAGGFLWAGILLVRAATTPLIFLEAAGNTLGVLGVFGAMGATLSTSLVLLAKKAARAELASGVRAPSISGDGNRYLSIAGPERPTTPNDT